MWTIKSMKDKCLKAKHEKEQKKNIKKHRERKMHALFLSVHLYVSWKNIIRGPLQKDARNARGIFNLRNWLLQSGLWLTSKVYNVWFWSFGEGWFSEAIWLEQKESAPHSTDDGETEDDSESLLVMTWLYMVISVCRCVSSRYVYDFKTNIYVRMKDKQMNKKKFVWYLEQTITEMTTTQCVHTLYSIHAVCVSVFLVLFAFDRMSVRLI